MHRVFSSHSQCAHVWAQQTQDDGRAKNVSFDGTTFYSYGTPIANFVTDKDGVRVVLFTERSYSTSSGKHLNHAMRAVGEEYGHGPNEYVVPHLCVEGGWSNKTNVSGDQRVIISHRLNLAWMLNAYNERVASAKRAVKYVATREEIEGWAARVHRYAERFEVDLEAVGVTMPDVEADWQSIVAVQAKRNSPEAVAKRDAAAKRRFEREVAEGREAFRRAESPFDLNYNPDTHGVLAYFSDDDRAARDAIVGPQIEQARQDYRMVTGRFGEGFHSDPWFVTDDDKAVRRDRLAVIDQDRVAAWRGGAGVNPRRDSVGTMLRLTQDRRMIQTSWGAEFPAGHGKLAFPCILRMRTEGREYHRDEAAIRLGHSRDFRLGHFKIDSIDAEGNVRAGCHFVQWPEIERIARELDLLPPEGVAAA